MRRMGLQRDAKEVPRGTKGTPRGRQGRTKVSQRKAKGGPKRGKGSQGEAKEGQARQRGRTGLFTSLDFGAPTRQERCFRKVQGARGGFSRLARGRGGFHPPIKDGSSPWTWIGGF